MYKCPECSKEMIWITDQSDGESFSSEYYCHECKIEVVKYK